MKQTTSEIAGNTLIATATTLGAGSSYLGWIGHHSAALGVIMSFCFGVIGMIFYYLNYRKATKADNNEQRIKALELLNRELEREINNKVK